MNTCNEQFYENTRMCPFLQAPFNTITYHLIQDQTAQQFFMVNERTGEISVRRDLAADQNTEYSVSENQIINSSQIK